MTAMIGRDASTSGDGRGRAPGLAAAGMLGSSTGAAILAGLAVACHTLMFSSVGAGAWAWVAPLPVLLLAVAAPARRLVIAAWAIGSAQALLLNAPWLWPAMRDVFALPAPVIAAMLAVESQIVGGVPFAVLALLLALGARLPAPAFALYAPAAWVAVEYGRAHCPLSAPWGLLGSALSEWLVPAQVADLGGVYAVSFLAVLPSAALVALLYRGRSRSALAAVAVAALLLVAALAYGAWRLREVRAEMAAAPTWRIALVHAELANPERLAGPRALDNIERHLVLAPPSDVPLDLVVWPENTVSVLLEDNPALVRRIAVPAHRAPHLVGGPRLVGDAPRALRASAFAIGADGIAATYDKRRLVPLAETGGGGWAPLLGFGTGEGAGRFEIGGVCIAPSICFEAVFPELARADVRGGAALLVNLSNDAWFTPGVGPRLHFLFTRLRAIETRRALARVANGGITALVLPDGRLAASSTGPPGALLVSAPLLHALSPYTRLGDAFAWLCIAATACGAIAARLRQG